MRGTVLYGPRDVRSEKRPDPTIVEPTDAIIRLAATCVCGSDLWPYRGFDAVTVPMPMRHAPSGFPAGSSSSRTSTCTAGPHPCAASCRS